jgi:hypothetical protein
MRQLVGLKCSVCQQRISSILEGSFCDQCGSPLHDQCRKAEATTGEKSCPVCRFAPSGSCTAITSEPSYPRRSGAGQHPATDRAPARQGKPVPTAILIIGIYLIVTSGLGTIGLLMALAIPSVQRAMSRHPLPVPVQVALSFVGLAISFTGGVAILNGRNWGRYLYVGWGISAFIFSAIVNVLVPLLAPPEDGPGLDAMTIILLIASLVIFIVVSIFLFRPAAERYFKPETKRAEAPQSSSPTPVS